jgi:hypothetical protein
MSQMVTERRFDVCTFGEQANDIQNASDQGVRGFAGLDT